MGFYDDGHYMGTEPPPPTPAWTPDLSLDYYKRGAHKFSDIYETCSACPARYWTGTDNHWCVVIKGMNDPYRKPVCTEGEWDLFVLEYI